MLNIEEFHIRNHPETIVMTQHGKTRMFERGIGVDDVIMAIDSGEIIREYDDDRPLPSCLILGKGTTGRAIHVVVSHDEKYIYLITAYYPDPALWSDDLKTRKETGK